MRIAVVGGLGLGFLLATGLSRADNAYNVVVLSRTPRREIVAQGIQVHRVNYYDIDSLKFALQGIDLVVSTISGQEQLNLIAAAGRAGIRYFVPSEFEGCLDRRPPEGQDPLKRDSTNVIGLLQQWMSASSMKYTVFSCGIIMERFHPLGLGSYNMGFGEGVDRPGSYLMDVNAGVVNCAEFDSKGKPVKMCLTSVNDLVRFIIAAVDLGPATWPREYRLRGDRMTIREIVDCISQFRGGPFERVPLAYHELNNHIAYNRQMGMTARVEYLQKVLHTANGRYDFSRATLNEAINKSSTVNMEPLTFLQWLAFAYSSLQ